VGQVMSRIGTYTALLFGCTGDGEHLRHRGEPGRGGRPTLAEVAAEIGLDVEISYECEPGYGGLRLAVSHPALAEAWQVPMLPSYVAAPLGQLGDRLREDVPGAAVEEAREAWERLRAHAEERHGLRLPEGEVLYVCDYG
jgi:hypothetical protein